MAEERSNITVAMVGLVGTVIGAAIVSGFSYFSHREDIDTKLVELRLSHEGRKHEIDVKMIELGIGILRAEVKEETTPLREWAIDVMDKRANFQFNEAQRAALLRQQLETRGSSYTFDSSYYPDDDSYPPTYTYRPTVRPRSKR